MTRFRFNLDPVLHYRQRLEETAKEELAGSLALYQKEKAFLEEVEDELSNTMVPANCGPLDLGQLLLKEFYQDFLEQQVEAQTARVETAEEAVETCRRQLEKKMQDRKVVEKIKEKRWKEFLYQQEQEEQKLIDDMATAQYIRQSVEK